MRRAAIVVLLLGCSSPPPADRIGALARRLRDSLPAGEGGYYIRDLQDGETLEMRAEEPFLPDGKSPREIGKLLEERHRSGSSAAGIVTLPNGRTYVAVFLPPRAEGSVEAASSLLREYMLSKP